jgi:hypothetical protein
VEVFDPVDLPIDGDCPGDQGSGGTNLPVQSDRTDGLSNMVDAPGIEAILNQPGPVEARTERLIAAANEAGGLDNISVVVVDVREP